MCWRDASRSCHCGPLCPHHHPRRPIVTLVGRPERRIPSRVTGRSVRVGEVPETVAARVTRRRKGCPRCSIGRPAGAFCCPLSPSDNRSGIVGPCRRFWGGHGWPGALLIWLLLAVVFSPGTAIAVAISYQQTSRTLIVTFGPTIGWAGKTITYDKQGFSIGGVGRVSARACSPTTSKDTSCGLTTACARGSLARWGLSPQAPPGVVAPARRARASRFRRTSASMDHAAGVR